MTTIEFCEKNTKQQSCGLKICDKRRVWKIGIVFVCRNSRDTAAKVMRGGLQGRRCINSLDREVVFSICKAMVALFMIVGSTAMRRTQQLLAFGQFPDNPAKIAMPSMS